MDLYLSPSENHRQVMAQQTQQLAFDGGPVPPWQARLRPKLAELVAVPDVERPPLAPRTLWREETELGAIEKLTFAAEDHSDVVAYFCAPAGVAPPWPTVICLQGHSTGMHKSIARDIDDETKPIEVAGDRDFGLGAMRHGFAALCIEQRSFGYRGEKKQERTSSHPCHDAAMHALMLGRTLAGERVLDVDRGLDYLAARSDIDMTRVGVMGNSGGGTVTLYSAALLDRIQFAMPSCSYCTFRDSIMSIYHCADNYVPGLLKWAEAADVLGLFAPKPVVVVAGATDPIFPIDGVREAFGSLQKIYAAAGAEDRCALVVGSEGHRFYEDLGWGKLLELLT